MKDEKYYYVQIMNDVVGIRYKTHEIFIGEDAMKNYIKFYKEHIQDNTTNWIHDIGICKVCKNGKIALDKSLLYDDDEIEE